MVFVALDPRLRGDERGRVLLIDRVVGFSAVLYRLALRFIRATLLMEKNVQDGFDKSKIPVLGAEDVDQINKALRRLKKRRKKEIVVEGIFLKSKLAWKVATYQEAVLYRSVMLAEGCVLAWNMNNSLSSFLSARAFVETVAVFLDFEQQCVGYLDKSDFSSIDELVTNRTFSTRDEKWVRESPETSAINVLTAIDRIDRRMIEGLRRHYDFLSERCHPNWLGQLFFFSKLDTNTGITTYSENMNMQANLDHVLGGMLLVGLLENSLKRVDQMVIRLAGAHSSFDPVR